MGQCKRFHYIIELSFIIWSCWRIFFLMDHCKQIIRSKLFANSPCSPRSKYDDIPLRRQDVGNEVPARVLYVKLFMRILLQRSVAEERLNLHTVSLVTSLHIFCLQISIVSPFTELESYCTDLFIRLIIWN